MFMIIYIILLILIIINRILYKKGSSNKIVKTIKEVDVYLIIIVLVLLIRTYIVTPVRVDGQSMNPNLNNGEILLLEKYDKDYSRFDIVVLKHGSKKLIKRVIGLPGEYIEYTNNTLFVDGKKVEENFKTKGNTYSFDVTEIDKYQKIPKGYYLVMGDNRVNSLDSRLFGLVKKNDLKGKAIIVLYPFSKFGNINDN